MTDTKALDTVKKELDHKKKEAEDYLSHLKRLQADFENFIKRTDKERKDLAVYASENLVLKLLTVLDEFEAAIDSMKKQGSKEEVIKGVDLLYKNFHKILQGEGVQPVKTTGKADPYLHEVVLKEDNGAESGTILEVIQKGYKMKDKVIRYAKVKVAGDKQNG